MNAFGSLIDTNSAINKHTAIFIMSILEISCKYSIHSNGYQRQYICRSNFYETGLYACQLEVKNTFKCAIVRYAEENHADVIVFEYLEMQGKISGKKKTETAPVEKAGYPEALWTSGTQERDAGIQNLRM